MGAPSAARFWTAAFCVFALDFALAEAGVSLVHRLIPLFVLVALIIAGLGAFLERNHTGSRRRPMQ